MPNRADIPTLAWRRILPGEAERDCAAARCGQKAEWLLLVRRPGQASLAFGYCPEHFGYCPGHRKGAKP